MAIRQRVVTLDDIDGTEGASTVTFGIDGRWFEIDLCPENAGALRDALKPYVRKARATAPPKMKDQNTAIRRWAKDQGYAIGDRGRISQDIVKAYRSRT
ncbi:Lsr2 family protein [Nesterenkonia rhizosphaerae]|uniref:Lsr2 family protein n=1 Tax=Nesterenkonia rhizosphaerae TaxID=1348272 RepID=A0ABP9G1E1_9MICC